MMFKVPLPELKEKIISSGKLSKEALDTRIKEKINELSGLISEEGAAHIIANELGIDLVKQSERLKVKEVYAGMRDVSVVGKVVRKFEVRELAKGTALGKVGSLVLGDETGTMRVVFWNEQVQHLLNIHEEDIVQVKHAYVKENNNGRELHLGERGELVINPEGEDIKAVRHSATHERKRIQELQDGIGAELLVTIVQVFDPRFFQVCSRCNRKVMESMGKYSCQEHGEVTPGLSYVLNLILDDGTGTVRGIFWKNQMHHLLGKEEKEMQLYKEDLGKFESVKTDLLGEQFKVTGTVRRNEMFDRLEFNVQLVEKARAEEETARLEKG